LETPLDVGARVLYRAIRTICAALLACYFLLVLLQVFFRYVLNESLFWAEELIRNGLVWGVMLGLSSVAYQRSHIRIDLLEAILPPGGQRALQFVCNSLVLAFCLTLMWTGAQFVDRTWFQNSPTLEVPKWTVYFAIPIGAALEALFTLYVIRSRDFRPSHADPTL
jgi:TRAP-type C4-dicarboxylate transport system permease small subunit